MNYAQPVMQHLEVPPMQFEEAIISTTLKWDISVKIVKVQTIKTNEDLNRKVRVTKSGY